MFVAFCDHVDGELDVALLEGVAALLVVRDDRVAGLPLDVVERVPSLGREVPLEGQSLTDDLDVPLFRRHLHTPPSVLLAAARSVPRVEDLWKNHTM